MTVMQLERICAAFGYHFKITAFEVLKLAICAEAEEEEEG